MSDTFEYVVLQATPTSLTFYERFGFTRVGAITRYESNMNRQVGYRHWTYADEKQLANHGGPSYMMALKLDTLRGGQGVVRNPRGSKKLGNIPTPFHDEGPLFRCI
jgi:hypothetical protein